MAHPSSRRGLIALLAAAVCLEAAPAATGQRLARWSTFDRGAFGEPVVLAHINGSGPYRLILDTGSSHTLVTGEVASALSLPVVDHATMTTTAGEETQAIVRIDALAMAPLEAVTVLASVVPAATLGRTEQGISGILGQDVLATRRFTLDFGQGRIAWDVPALDGSKRSSLHLHSEEGLFIAELPQSDSVLRLVPDTGAADFLLYQRTGRPLPAIAQLAGVGWVNTLTGRTRVQMVYLRELRVGTVTLAAVRAGIVRQTLLPPACDGLLPLHAFARVTFDGPSRLLHLEL